MALTPRKRRFIEEYMLDLNATQSAIRSGYRKSCAHRTGPILLKDPEVAAELRKRICQRSEDTAMDANWVLWSAREVYDRCMQKKPVTDNKGKPTGEFRFSASGANKALEIIAKHVDIRAFDNSVDIVADIEVNDISSTEAARRIAFAMTKKLTDDAGDS